MPEKNKILIYSAIFYACSSANIYLAIRFLLAGEYVYPIFFWILFGLDKIIIIMNMKKYLPFLADFFQLGTIYLLFYDSSFNLSNFAIGIMSLRVFPLLFTQSIFYFGGDLLANPLVSSQDAFLAYLLFLAYLIIAIVCFTEIEQNMPFLMTFPLHLSAGFTLLSSVVLISKDFSFNFGYLHIIIVGIEPIAIYLNNSRHISWICIHFLNGLLFFIFNQDNESEVSWESKLAQISSYFQMSIKFILVLCFGLEKLLNFYQHMSDLSSYEIIQLINLTLALTFGSLYAAYYFKQFVMAFIDFKIFFLRNSNAVINAMNYLKQTKKLPHNISFIFYRISGIDLREFRLFLFPLRIRNMPLFDECSNAECKLHYQLISLINTVKNQKGYNLELDYYPLSVICTRHIKKILEKQPHLLAGFFNLFTRQLDQQQILYILNKRIQNGFVFTKLTLELMNYFKRIIDTNNQFLNQTAIITQVNAFNKLIQPSMLYSSQRILYDLYGD